jgi:hypothetical protein
MATYSPEVEQTMQKYYATLSEKDQRRYAAIEALKLPPAEHSYIAKLTPLKKGRPQTRVF